MATAISENLEPLGFPLRIVEIRLSMGGRTRCASFGFARFRFALCVTSLWHVAAPT